MVFTRTVDTRYNCTKNRHHQAVLLVAFDDAKTTENTENTRPLVVVGRCTDLLDRCERDMNTVDPFQPTDSPRFSAGPALSLHNPYDGRNANVVGPSPNRK